MTESLNSFRGHHAPALPTASINSALAMFSALTAGATVAYLVSSGRWYVALALLLAVPAFVVLHRYPLISLIVWLVVAPLVTETDDDSVRKAFWLFHRALPLVTLAVLMSSYIAGLRTRQLGKLGWPEIMMAGYLVASLLSIAYTSREPLATAYILYDRVFIPMCLYVIVRLLQPDERDLRRLLPAVIFVLLSQSLLGLISWIDPEALPSEWLNEVGQRTTGSLRAVNVFGTTILFCSLFVLHSGLTMIRHRVSSLFLEVLFAFGLLMVFLTFSRATWLAGLVVLGGSLYVYRRFAKQLLIVMVPVVFLLLASGILSEQITFARQRLQSEESEESALSRLPVAYAAVRMFEAKPIAGWGYENFDLFDRPFQTRVGNLISPDKDHASHNLYLTILAEQGLIGFILFVGPTIYWLLATRSNLTSVPATSPTGRELLAGLWLVLAGYIIVNNFSSTHVTFGLSLWWLTLGLIGSIVDRYSSRLSGAESHVVGKR